MKYVRQSGSNIVVELPISEVRALLDIVNECIEGEFSLSQEEWEQVMVHPKEMDEKLIDDLAAVIDRFDAKS